MYIYVYVYIYIYIYIMCIYIYYIYILYIYIKCVYIYVYVYIYIYVYIYMFKPLHFLKDSPWWSAPLGHVFEARAGEEGNVDGFGTRWTQDRQLSDHTWRGASETNKQMLGIC